MKQPVAQLEQRRARARAEWVSQGPDLLGEVVRESFPEEVTFKPLESGEGRFRQKEETEKPVIRTFPWLFQKPGRPCWLEGHSEDNRGGSKPRAMGQLPRGVTLSLAASACRSAAALFPPPSGKPRVLKQLASCP